MRGKRRPTGRQLVVLIVALGILVEVPLVVYVLGRDDSPRAATAPSGLGGATAGLPLHPVAGNFEPDQTTVEQCSEQTCFEQAYGNIAYYEGAKTAFALVEKRYSGGADPRCHRIAHAIGAASLARNNGNVARTFADGSATCWSGYYHGVLERAFLEVKSFDADTLGAKSRALCADRQVRRSSWLTYQCLHGLGHGLMITTGYQLPLTLDVCRRLATDWDRKSCKGGVFMENFITSYGGQSPWVRDDDPLYPCNWVAEQDKLTCYQQATTRIVRVVGSDWTKIARTCAEAEPAWVITCFGSYGQHASVVANHAPQQILPACAVARSFGGEEECLRYAAMDMAGAYLGGTEAARLCDKAVVALRASCYHAVGLMLRYLRNTPSERRAECREIASETRYAARCVAGAARVSSIPGLTR
jgi:hypothetical protein